VQDARYKDSVAYSPWELGGVHEDGKAAQQYDLPRSRSTYFVPHRRDIQGQSDCQLQEGGASD